MFQATWITQCALLLLDTRMPYGSLNIDCEESLDPAGSGSFYNNGEADIVAQHVLSLVQCGMSLFSLNGLPLLCFYLLNLLCNFSIFCPFLFTIVHSPPFSFSLHEQC